MILFLVRDFFYISFLFWKLKLYRYEYFLIYRKKEEEEQKYVKVNKKEVWKKDILSYKILELKDNKSLKKLMELVNNYIPESQRNNEVGFFISIPILKLASVFSLIISILFFAINLFINRGC